MPLISSLRRRLAPQDGFTMALVMGLLIFASLLGLAAYASAQGDRSTSADTRDRKQAYAAAEAGLNWYLARLNVDSNFWSKCSYNGTPPAAAGSNGVPRVVNTAWNGSGADPRYWQKMTSTSTAEYTLEMLPAPGNASCSQSTMIDSKGTFRVRSTGRYNGIKRTIVARFARIRFLDFLWFTQYETTDPLAYSASNQANANTYCAKYRAARDAQSTFDCQEIQFGGGDQLHGPLHSNDNMLICPPVTFGDSATDKAESSQTPAYTIAGGCSGQPTVASGSITAGTKTLDMPPTNDELDSMAGLNYTGDTAIVLKGSVMDVTTGNPQTTTTNVPIPANGLIYVGTDTSRGCGTPQPPILQTYGVGAGSESKGCANVYVRGSYSKDLTIASAKDIVITGDLTYPGASDAMLGLIATNFVRVFHPTTTHSGTGNVRCSGGSNTTATVGAETRGATDDIEIDAAILSLLHGFTVDSYNCGATLGQLNLTGAIAQNFRGAVSLSGSTGYVKNYVYDSRMKYRSPPLFLDPINAAWQIQRMNEQTPAR
jgi:Tfp pilus assembly protein PilX